MPEMIIEKKQPLTKQYILLRTITNYLMTSGIFEETGWAIKENGGFYIFMRPKFLFADMFKEGTEPNENYCFLYDLPSEDTLSSAEILYQKASEIVNEVYIEYVKGGRQLIGFEKDTISKASEENPE